MERHQLLQTRRRRNQSVPGSPAEMMWSSDHMDSVQILSHSLSLSPTLSLSHSLSLTLSLSFSPSLSLSLSFIPLRVQQLRHVHFPLFPRIIVFNNVIHNFAFWKIIVVNPKKSQSLEFIHVYIFCFHPKWVCNSLELFLIFSFFLKSVIF